MLNSSDNLLYNLSYLSSVIHPVIILRLLEHRIFTPLFKKKSIPTNLPNAKPPPVVPTLSTLPRPDLLLQKRSSFGKSNSKITRVVPTTSTVTNNNSPMTTNNELPSNLINPANFSLLLTNNSNQTMRKWFWRNSDKNYPLNPPNDRNPLLQAITESDLINPLGSVPLVATNIAGVGDMKLFEKELLNLPSFQLSDSQNPLLPSPTCLNEDFPAQFDSANPSSINVTPNRQYSTSKTNDHDRNERFSFSFIEYSLSFLVSSSAVGRSTPLHIPFVAVYTPSDDNHRLVSRDNPPISVRRTMANFFRTSKTIDNISSMLNPGHALLSLISPTNGNHSRLRTSSHFSHSQPSINENMHCQSPFLIHTEQTPLIERRIPTNNHKNSLDSKPIHSSRQELHLLSNNTHLPRSRSCTDGMNRSNRPENDSPQAIIASLQPRSSDTTSIRSGDSTGSSLSAYLTTQQQMNTPQTSAHQKNEMNKSQESIFSFSSPLCKARSIKSLIMAAATNDRTTRQDNDVLLLIASWVLRSPEDFQGKRNDETYDME